MTAQEYLEQVEVTIKCEGCQRKTLQSYRWLKSNIQYLCTCGQEINLRSDRMRKLIARLESEAEAASRERAA